MGVSSVTILSALLLGSIEGKKRMNISWASPLCQALCLVPDWSRAASWAGSLCTHTGAVLRRAYACFHTLSYSTVTFSNFFNNFWMGPMISFCIWSYKLCSHNLHSLFSCRLFSSSGLPRGECYHLSPFDTGVNRHSEMDSHLPKATQLERPKSEFVLRSAWVWGAELPPCGMLLWLYWKTYSMFWSLEA